MSTPDRDCPHTGYVTKPFDLDVVLDTIDQLVG